MLPASECTGRVSWELQQCLRGTEGRLLRQHYALE